MKFTKIFRDEVEHAYAVLHLKNQDRDFLIVASEEDKACYAYDLDQEFERIEVWPDVGGTMTMVQIPGTLDFLATQRFYPGFQAASCRLVRENFNGTDWDQSVVAEVPYVHRFDLIPFEDQNGYWYVGCSVASSKAYPEDWSDPGRVFVGEYDHLHGCLKDVRDMGKALTKNHGYYRMGDKGYSFITSAEGIYKLHFPRKNKDWSLEQVNDRETSDIVSCDINADGRNEYMAIEGFHGDRLRFYDTDFHDMASDIGAPTPFGHAIFGGNIWGNPCFIFGYRAGKQDLLYITQESGKLNIEMIDHQTGTSNVLVYEKNHKFFLLAANRESNEAAVYEITE